MAVALDGHGWQLRGCLGDEWRWHVGPDKPWDAPGWLPARVPGSVADDLCRAGEVPDPYRERNSRLLEWVPQRSWVYRRRVEGPGRIRFEGVDHAATVFVDGAEAAFHDGAFAPFELDVPGGEHLLAVVVHPAPASEPQVGLTSRVRVHKSRMGYGWDFCPSEFGVEGMTNRAALEALIDEEHRWPCDRSNPVYEHLGAWWNNAPFVQRAFGGRIADVETMRRASQWLQYDGLRYAVEATLRRGAGTIPWQLNESYPNAWCTAVVDWHGEPKPAYWGVRRAYLGAPTASFATCAWGGAREVRARIHGDVVARILDADGRVVAEARDEIAVPLDAIATDVFALDLDGLNRYVMTKTENLEPLLELLPDASGEDYGLHVAGDGRS